MAKLVGPKKSPRDFGFMYNDTHLIVNDASQTMKAFSHTGTLLWEIPCLARGQGSDTNWTENSTDTPPGLYKLGTIYNDYAKFGLKPNYSRTLAAYGWVFYDMVELEGQERRYNRAGIGLHGGGSALGWPGAWSPHQTLLPTLGCCRIRNADLIDKILPLYKKGTVFVSVFQETL
jgi:hypothetical protein